MIRIINNQNNTFSITSDEGYLTFDAFDLNTESNILFSQLKRLGWAVGVNCGWNVNENPSSKTIYSKFRKVAGLIVTPWPLQ